MRGRLDEGRERGARLRSLTSLACSRADPHRRTKHVQAHTREPRATLESTGSSLQFPDPCSLFFLISPAPARFKPCGCKKLHACFNIMDPQSSGAPPSSRAFRKAEARGLIGSSSRTPAEPTGLSLRSPRTFPHAASSSIGCSDTDMPLWTTNAPNVPRTKRYVGDVS